MSIFRFMAKRALQSVPTLAVVTVVVFGLMHVAPGDPVVTILGTDYSPETERALRDRLGLDEPLPAQYLSWLGNLITGDFGTSIRTREPILTMIGDRIVATATLAGLAFAASLVIAVPIGVLSAAKRNSPLDYSSMALAIFGLSIPSFVLAILLILLFSVRLDLLPIAGYVSLWTRPGEAWQLLVLPVVTLGTAQAAVLARMVRSSLLDVLNRDYIQVARAKGLHRRHVLLRHALKNSLIPVITIAAINFGHLLGGSVVVEQIFGIPGIGSLLVDAILFRDFPVIQGVTLVASVSFILANLVADLLYSLIDPRVRYGR